MDEKNAEITKRSHAYKGYASTYNVKILNSFNPELQLKDIESAIKNKLIGLLFKSIGFKFVATLVLEFKNIESNDETKCNIFYLNSKAEAINNESDIIAVFESIYVTATSNIKKSLEGSSGWILDSVLDHIINI